MSFWRLTGSVFALGSLSVSVQAAEPGPIVAKRNQSGFTTQLGVREEVCSVYRNRVEIVRRFGTGPGSFEQRERRPVHVSPGVRDAVRGALAEEVEATANFLCDGPVTQTFIGPLDSDDILFHTGGCGADRQERQGDHSRALRQLVDTYCPLTHETQSRELPESGGE